MWVPRIEWKSRVEELNWKFDQIVKSKFNIEFKFKVEGSSMDNILPIDEQKSRTKDCLTQRT